jgi:hypothetical protein
MITKDLYKEALVSPAQGGSNELYIVSGYASATFARRHIKDLLEHINVENLSLNLIIGMPSKRVDHVAYLQLHEEFGPSFKGYYLNSGAAPVHSKVFSWYKSGAPVLGFTGSANYSQFGFFEAKQINQLVEDDAIGIKAFFDELLQRSSFIPDVEIKNLPKVRSPKIVGSIAPSEIEWIIPEKSVRISFLDRQGNLPAVSGLNWGQRTENRKDPITGVVTTVKREPNQAYLSLKGDSRKEGFLPKRAYNFTLSTDDGHSFDCVRAQDGDKAIQSTNNNSELGLYFRRRLGLKDGSFIRTEDLEKYGRTDYTITKIDEENYILDFSKADPGE